MGSRPVSLFLVALCMTCLSAVVYGAEEREGQRLDVLMFVVDDLNDWITVLDESAPILTPSLNRLASQGTLFTRAYCVSAACNPSRVATLTGLRPSSSGVYGNRTDWRRALPQRLTIMQRFREAGYLVRGAGKVFHHHLNGAFHDSASFDEFHSMRPQLYPPVKLNRAPEYGSRNTDWGAWPRDPTQSIDQGTVEYCVNALRDTPLDRPLFLVCGIFKPHSPFFAPATFHRAYESLSLPLRREDDRDDLPSGAIQLIKGKDWFWRGMMALEEKRPESYLSFVRSYAACASYADSSVGRVLAALEASPRAGSTIIVLWSDHGFHLGEKNHIEKFALWEKSNHIPFIVVAPGVTTPGYQCEVPVDLSCLYPTLLELAELPRDDACDGESVVSLLRGETEDQDRAAVMTYQKGNHAVRSERWRYIRYADGSEELYDHESDPTEWRNLATDESYRSVIEHHRKWLPKAEAEPAGDLKR